MAAKKSLVVSLLMREEQTMASLPALLLVLLAWLLLCGPAQAEIVESGSTIEFRGNLRPGDIPRAVVIAPHAFGRSSPLHPG